MAGIWVVLCRPKQIRKGGVTKTYHPGESVEVGKQTALRWLLDGSAVDQYGQLGPVGVATNFDREQFGIRIRKSTGQANLAFLGKLTDQVPISYGPPELACKFTFIWRPDLVIFERTVAYGFLKMQLGAEEDSWEIAAPLLSLKSLAKDIGSAEDKAKTKKVIGDLRFPVYDSRAVWVRKCPAAERVIAAWVAELEAGGGEYHSFIRALYTKRAMLCTLPAGWTRHG